MARKYSKVLALFQSKPDGRIEVDDPELFAALGPVDRGRIACHMSDIRRYAKLEIVGIREGRKVVAYQLAAVTPTDANTSAPESASTGDPTTTV